MNHHCRIGYVRFKREPDYIYAGRDVQVSAGMFAQQQCVQQNANNFGEYINGSEVQAMDQNYLRRLNQQMFDERAGPIRVGGRWYR